MEEQKIDGSIIELEQGFLEFARVVLTKLKQWILTEGLYGFTYFAHFFNEHGYNRETQLEPEYGTFLQLQINDLLSLEATQQCAHNT